MSDNELPRDVMEAALGLTGKAGGIALYEAWLWLGEDEGPYDGVPLYRHVTQKVWAAGGDLKAGAAVHRELRRHLQAGQLRVFGVSSDGAWVDIPASISRGFGKAVDDFWRLGIYHSPSDLGREYRVFVRARLYWWPGEEQDLTNWCAMATTADGVARERLKTRGQRSLSEAAICQELSSMWREAGRKGGSPKTIETLRRKTRGR